MIDMISAISLAILKLADKSKIQITFGLYYLIHTLYSLMLSLWQFWPFHVFVVNRVVENTEAGRVMQDSYEQQLSIASQTKKALDERVQHLLKERDDLIVLVSLSHHIIKTYFLNTYSKRLKSERSDFRAFQSCSDFRPSVYLLEPNRTFGFQMIH